MARFEKGNKASKGRPAGLKPKKILRKAEDTMVTLGFNPIIFLVNLAEDSKTPIDIKAKIGLALSEFVCAKAKTNESESKGGESGLDKHLPDDRDELKKLTPNGKRGA